jgi:hypothetical protein
MSEEEIPPPNPFYERIYQTTTSGGYAKVTIRAPGGKINRQDALDLIEWFGLITDRLKRDAEAEEAKQ